MQVVAVASNKWWRLIFVVVVVIVVFVFCFCVSVEQLLLVCLKQLGLSCSTMNNVVAVPRSSRQRRLLLVTWHTDDQQNTTAT